MLTMELRVPGWVAFLVIFVLIFVVWVAYISWRDRKWAQLELAQAQNRFDEFHKASLSKITKLVDAENRSFHQASTAIARVRGLKIQLQRAEDDIKWHKRRYSEMQAQLGRATSTVTGLTIENHMLVQRLKPFAEEWAASFGRTAFTSAQVFDKVRTKFFNHQALVFPAMLAYEARRTDPMGVGEDIGAQYRVTRCD